MSRWLNPALRVYHGTSAAAAGIAMPASGAPLSYAGLIAKPLPVPFVINLARCRPFTDFGQGFYVTTSLHQAREWANTKVRSWTSRTQALVLEFAPDRDWLATLEALCFVRPTQDFWDLVHDCRNRFPPHQRIYPHGPYDVVFGPVSIWPSRLLIADCDQISFHTARSLIGMGSNPIVVDIAPSRLFP
jgi:hypothetical protein